MVKEEQSPRIRHRGIYLLPNLFTVAALFAGFYAIVAATKDHFETSAIAIFVGILLDSLDGRIARLTGSQSEFGAQMDSLSDMICFGVAPALVLYIWSLWVMGKPGWLAAFFYTTCTALRLARFSAQSQSTNKRYFQGLATPAAAGLVASMIWVCVRFDIDGKDITLWMTIVAIILGMFKVSTIRYRSFKDIDLRNKVPFITVLVIVLVLVFISFDPPTVLLGIFFIYVCSGPVMTLWQLQKRRKIKRLRGQKRQSGENKKT